MARRRLTPASPSPAPDGPRSARPAGLPGMPPIASVAGEAATEAALAELTRGLDQARAEGRLILALPLADIAPGHLSRDRISVDEEEMQALVDSLQAHGQRTPVEVAAIAGPQPYGLISGWRRYHALSHLQATTGEARFATIQAIVRHPSTAAEAYIAMVEENEIRVGLSHYERARVVAATVDLGVFDTERAALQGLFGAASRAKRSKIGSFLELHRHLGDRLRFPARIPERLGLALVEALRAGKGASLRARLASAAPETPEAELALLQAALRGDVSRAKHSAERRGPPEPTGRTELFPGVTLTISRGAGEIALKLEGPGVTEELHDEVHAAVLALRDRTR
ncbi:ParB/RepB/Spo0J family partition protein [Paroceanicella profunda]|uniref:ParB/RepB/Spo0J family partition protein n=1 Tax=Paroceanicella profunda TaxID=2579971 RepID=UPI001EF0B060|nr:ParB/RepB/Spo0J family partition protein [Paroceanicella profunda]